jgi:hypothetical protein
MRNYRNAFWVAACFAALLFASVGVANAQIHSDRDVRDALRSMNSKLDDFDANMRYQIESTGAGDADRVARQIDDLRKAVDHFEDKLDSHRENARDVEQIVNAAAAIDDFLFQNPQNRRVTDDWQSVRRQIDRISNQYGVTNDWDRGVSNTSTRSNGGNGNYGRSTSTTTTGGGMSAGARIIPPPTAVKGGNSRVRQPSYSGGDNLATGLSGTYTLDRAQTENIDDVVASSGASAANQADLKDKLNAPDQIAIDIRGNQVTLATSSASPVTFTADGRDKVENVNGRSVTMRATLSGDKLVISSLGGETDFTVTFTAAANGQQLKVSRRMTTDYLSQTVFAESVYNKTDNQARLGISQNDPGNNSSYPTNSTPDNDPVVASDNNTIPSSDNNTGSTSTTTSDSNGGYSDNDQGNATIANGGTGGNGGNGGYNNPKPNRTGSNPRRSPQPSAVYVKPGNYVVPDGSMITGLLENEINTKLSQNGDRFRLTVQSPNEFRGAVIEGFVSNIQRSGKVTGSAAVTFNFEKITLSDGQTYDFAGTLRTAADSVGRTAKVDNEGTVRGDSQTAKTAKRSGIGAGLGALIGLIAGGGHGAAIGAIIGGGGGAGSVYFEDRKDVMLNQGSTLTLQAAAPSR